MTISKEMLIKMYKIMLTIRHFEKNLWDLYTSSLMSGFAHLYIGEEAVATGACLALSKGDFITSTHRGHGHVIAKGADLKKMIAELLGRKEGYCKGKAGSMHIADLSLGVIGANGIVGGGIPIATGVGLSAKMRNSGQVVVCFFGDGASNQGTFHESLNMASIWKLPVIYICENNLYAVGTPQKLHQNIENIADRASAYGIKGVVVDGMDVIAVYNAVVDAIENARSNGGPTLIEAKTYRFVGHSIGDPGEGISYRSKEEMDYWKENKCPIMTLRAKLLKDGIANEKDLDELEKEIVTEIKEATDYAKSCSFPEPSELYNDVFTTVN